jgi:flagellar biosynthesis protein FlhG
MVDQATRLREIAEQYCERPRIAKPHVITVTSGKGGVGKSMIALNLAVRLAELANQTLLFDADENLGNIDVMAGISPKARIGDLLRGEKDLEDILISPMKNLSILPGHSGDDECPTMTIAKQKELLDDITDRERRFDYVVIDTSAGLGENVVSCAVHSHETLVVTNPEPTALMDAYAIIKMISLADAMVPVKIVMNAAHDSDAADDSAAKLQMAVKHFLKRHVQYLGSIPYDISVSKAIHHQRAVVKEFPMSRASLSLNMLAERIVEQATSTRVRRFQTV